ncbi:MAG TPA: carbohydrate-binding family 9-like protein [Chthoniobacteraceae bacterium]|nr:carbohydrate-binding family 9-like protein [Chthoniobacteraceae bacterium]
MDARDADFWRGIEPVHLKENVGGGQPAQATWFKTAWTEAELRVLFHATDNDAWATHTAHDAPLYEEEVVEVFLDPAGDLQSYFEIEVNPLNAVCDLVLRRTRGGLRKDFGWHCEGLKTSVNKTANAWTVEIAIPFASLAPGLPSPGKPWRANFYRIDRPKNARWELSAWSPTGRELFHVPEQFGYLDFVTPQ